jgi:hypothetical protein
MPGKEVYFIGSQNIGSDVNEVCSAVSEDTVSLYESLRLVTISKKTLDVG